MLFLLVTSIGALTITKNKAQEGYEEIHGPKLADIERMLDAENERLDRELAGLLHLHRELSAGRPTRDVPIVDLELERAFEALEESDGGDET